MTFDLMSHLYLDHLNVLVGHLEFNFLAVKSYSNLITSSMRLIFC